MFDLESKVGGFAIKWVLLAALVVLVASWGVSKIIGRNHQEAVQGQTNAGSAKAMQEAGQVAVATVLEQTKEEVALKDLVATASKEIDNAPTPQAARAATLGAACQLQLYRNDPACIVRPADTP